MINQTLNTTLMNTPKFMECLNNRWIENLVLFLSISTLFEFILILILFWIIRNNFRKQTENKVVV